MILVSVWFNTSAMFLFCPLVHLFLYYFSKLFIRLLKYLFILIKKKCSPLLIWFQLLIFLFVYFYLHIFFWLFFFYRAVTYSQGSVIAAEFGIPFIECSSKTGENVGEAFSLLLSEVEKENPVELADNFSQPECVIV